LALIRWRAKFEGVVSSTLKPLESQVSKDEVFVTTFYTARDYTDQFANLNFIINMKSSEGEGEEGEGVLGRVEQPTGDSSRRNKDSRARGRT